MPFKPGNPGTPGEKSRVKGFAAMLNIAIREAGKAEGTTKLRDVADTLVNEAIAGNIQAIKEIADRLDGKVPQAVIGDEDGAPITFRVVIGGHDSNNA